MARWRDVDLLPKVIRGDFSKQILPGTLERALHVLVDDERNLSPFSAALEDDLTGAPRVPPRRAPEDCPVRLPPRHRQFALHRGHLPRSHRLGAGPHRSQRSMVRTLVVVPLLLTLLLGGCVTPIPLNTLKYDQKTTVTSTKEAAVFVTSGAVRGGSGSMMLPVGGIFIPVSTGPNPEFQFHSEDQQAFAESLRIELVRLGILKSAIADQNANVDLRIQVIFAQTYHDPSWQEYVLDVVAEMTGGKEPLLRQYRVVSSEKDSTWEKWNTNAYEGKVKAARRLMEKLVPDIERYVASM